MSTILVAALVLGLFVFSSTSYGQTMTIPGKDSSVLAQASPARSAAADDRSMVFETLKVTREGAVLFAEIAAPPMNLLGTELVAGFPPAGHITAKERVNAVGLALADDFRRDSDLFVEGFRNPEAQSRTRAAIKSGLQTREAEKSLGRLLGDLADR